MGQCLLTSPGGAPSTKPDIVSSWVAICMESILSDLPCRLLLCSNEGRDETLVPTYGPPIPCWLASPSICGCATAPLCCGSITAKSTKAVIKQ